MKKAVVCIRLTVAAAAERGFVAGGMHPSRQADETWTTRPAHRDMEPVYADWQPDDPDLAALPPGNGCDQPGAASRRSASRSSRVEKKPYTQLSGCSAGGRGRDPHLLHQRHRSTAGSPRPTPTPRAASSRKNETLAAFYSPEFLSAGQALLFALSSMDRVRTTGQETEAQKDQIAQFNINLQQYRDSLRNLGMGDLQIEEMIRTRKYMENVNITSPADGFILVRNVSLGQRFEKGTELYRIADISRVWILADVYETEAEAFVPGTVARVTLPHQKKTYRGQGQRGAAAVRPDHPHAQGAAGGGQPRLRPAAGHVRGRGTPGRLAEALIGPGRRGPRLRAAQDRVRGPGQRATSSPARWKPAGASAARSKSRRASTPGERIVISGNFLIDSESKLQLAAAGMQAVLAKDPVCGQEVSPRKAEKAGREGLPRRARAYYFCSEDLQGAVRETTRRATCRRPQEISQPAFRRPQAAENDRPVHK